MTVHVALASRRASASRADALAPSCRGLDFYAIDHSLKNLLPLYMEAPLVAHLSPHLAELGQVAGGRLHDCSDAAERHPPVLHARDAWGRDEEWIEYHPAYREMEQIAFGRFGIHAMCHRPGVLGWPAPMPPIAKYVFHYMFAQRRAARPLPRSDVVAGPLEPLSLRPVHDREGGRFRRRRSRPDGGARR
jgi:hypothetical protein